MHQCSKENQPDVKTGRDVSYCFIRFCTERCPIEIEEITGFLVTRQKLFYFSLPFPLKSQADFGVQVKDAMASFPADCLRLRMTPQIFDI